MDAVVDGPDGLTGAWLTDALASGVHSLSVETVQCQRIGTGQMGATYRLSLTYTGTPGPRSLIAKVAGSDEEMRRRVARGYAAEVGFYVHLAAGLETRTPTCWYGAITDDSTRFTLLLEDASPATPGVQAEGCTPVQASAAIRNLIGLHAPRWADPGLHCLGAQLARLEGKALFNELIPRLESVELTGPPSYMETLFVGGPKHLPIRFELS